MAKNFPQIPEAPQILSSTNTEKTTPRCIEVILLQTKRQILQAIKERHILKKQQN